MKTRIPLGAFHFSERLLGFVASFAMALPTLACIEEPGTVLPPLDIIVCGGS